MSETEKKKEFLTILSEGQPKWKYFPYNFQEGQPCPMGCIIKQRIAEPQDYVLSGDCRAPSSEHCCMNVQDRDREIREQNESTNIWATRVRKDLSGY